MTLSEILLPSLPPPPYPCALLDTAEMGNADRITIAAGTSGLVLMQRAGAAVAVEAARLLQRFGAGRGRILVLCGPGNNGGDGFVAASRLAAAGFSVTIGLLGDPGALRGDAAAAAAAWNGAVLPIADVDLAGTDLAVDALFGAGLGRDLDGAAAVAVTRLNAWRRDTRRPVLAVDVPSGIDGNTGQVRGVAVEADTSVTFFRFKPGHFLLPGRLHGGTLRLAQIGIAPDVLDSVGPRAFLNAPAFWHGALPLPQTAGHKYTKGHALILSGPASQTGAARLAAHGAAHAGAGLVTVATPTDALLIHAAALTAIMTRPCDDPAALSTMLEDTRKNAVVLGPGLGIGETTRHFVLAVLAGAPRGAVFDADALTSFGGDIDRLSAAIKAWAGHVVLTPHDGEFKHLFEGRVPAVDSASKLDRVRAAAALSGATVLLKGADTVVASPDGRATIAGDLPPWLATAGAGDVLAGIIGGLLAQAMPPFDAASAAVWMHGAAARHHGPGLVADVLAEQLPTVWTELLT